MVAGLGDPADYQLRGRRSGAGRLADARVKAEAVAKEMTQLDRLTRLPPSLWGSRCFHLSNLSAAPNFFT